MAEGGDSLTKGNDKMNMKDICYNKECDKPRRADWKTHAPIMGCGFIPFCSDECTTIYYAEEKKNLGV